MHTECRAHAHMQLNAFTPPHACDCWCCAHRADDGLRAACESDASALCQGVKHGGGQIQACLVSVERQRPG